MPDDCVFCGRIDRGEFDHANAIAVTFEPLNPVTPGHLLVVPREHVVDATVNPDLTGMVMATAARIARELRGDCNIITSVGAAATQTIRHLHVHVVPRREGDGLNLPWTGQITADAERFGVPVDAEADERLRADLAAVRDAERRPFCNTWPFPSSDLDIVNPIENAAVHRARGCCDGF